MTKTIGQLSEKPTPAGTDLIEIEDGSTGTSYYAELGNLPGTSAGAFKGCRLYRSSALAISAGTNGQAHTWTHESFDTDGFHDTGSNTDRITIPSGVSKVIVYGAAIREADATGTQFLYIDKYNSSNVLQGKVAYSSMNTASWDMLNCSSGPISVATGDYLIMKTYFENSSPGFTAGEYGNYFSLLVLE